MNKHHPKPNRAQRRKSGQAPTAQKAVARKALAGQIVVASRQQSKTELMRALAKKQFDADERRIMRNPNVMLEREDAGLIRYMRHGRV